MGHGVGDRVLVAVADRTRASLRPTDVAARFGGDEFAVLVAQASGQHQLDAIAQRILQALREPALIDGVIIPVCGTIGLAVAESASDTCDELLRRADVAMYAVKREGTDRVSVYRELAAEFKSWPRSGHASLPFRPGFTRMLQAGLQASGEEACRQCGCRR